MENDFSEAKTSLYRILHKLIFDNFKNDNEKKAQLLKIEKSINKIKSQKDAISIIKNTLSISNKL